jgi:hypothetical protein
MEAVILIPGTSIRVPGYRRVDEQNEAMSTAVRLNLRIEDLLLPVGNGAFACGLPLDMQMANIALQRVGVPTNGIRYSLAVSVLAKQLGCDYLDELDIDEDSRRFSSASRYLVHLVQDRETMCKVFRFLSRLSSSMNTTITQEIQELAKIMFSDAMFLLCSTMTEESPTDILWIGHLNSECRIACLATDRLAYEMGLLEDIFPVPTREEVAVQDMVAESEDDPFFQEIRRRADREVASLHEASNLRRD